MPINDESILDSIKKVRGIGSSDTSFDVDIIMSINSAFATLHQLGVGPTTPFYIEDNTPIWSEFIGGIENILSVKSYVALAVKLEFDPPSTSFALEAATKKLDEYAWRLNVASDHSVDSTDLSSSVTSDPLAT